MADRIRRDGRHIEQRNMWEACDLLEARGCRTATLVHDTCGVDLYVKTSTGTFLEVQLKGRITVDQRYMGKGIYMLFPASPYGNHGRRWYLVPHDELMALVKHAGYKVGNAWCGAQRGQDGGGAGAPLHRRGVVNALATITHPGTIGEHVAPMASAVQYAAASLSAGTLRCYRSDARAFKAWADAHGVCPLPTTPETLASYVASLADRGIRPSSIGRVVAAITYVHRCAGMETPATSMLVRQTVRGIRRTVGTAVNAKAPATSDVLRDMLKHVPTTLRGLRDTALLVTAFASALRRSELVALTVADLAFSATGDLRITVRKSKTDQTGDGQVVAVAAGGKFRAVERLRAYLDAAGVTDGLVFRRIRGSVTTADGIGGTMVAYIVKRYAAAAGYDPAIYSAHSTRSGVLTSCAEAGASIFKLQELSRHRSVQTLAGYVRSADLFKNHAGAGVI